MYNLQKSNKKYVIQANKKFYFSKLQNLEICYYNGIKNVVFISRNRYDQTERYRVEHMIEVIDDMEEWNALSIEPMNLSLLEKYLDYIDIIVFERSFYIEYYDRLIKYCEKKHITTIFEIDDLVFSKKYINLLIESTGVNNMEYWRDITQSYYKMGKLCSGYWTTNNYLADRIHDIFGKKVWTLNNFFNHSQAEVSSIYCNQKKSKENYDERFMIGYFSGTGTHYNDFMEINDEIAEFMKRHSDVMLKLVGYMKIPDRLLEYAKEGRIITLPFMDCCSLQKEIAEVDINLIPLVENEFTNCKSEIKYFEAAMVGTISCMTPTYVYKTLQEKNTLGYYCRKGDWLETLEELYIQKDRLCMNIDRLCVEAYKNYAYFNQKNKLKRILDEMKDYT